ncbi:hypothetical protein LCGC14_2193700, partial [marine sediment metagenome]
MVREMLNHNNQLPLCPQCPKRLNSLAHGPVPPNGPTPCRLMFIGEGPARDEVR